jgi:DNA-directed RNA polymerase subunit RPC12/RpoP
MRGLKCSNCGKIVSSPVPDNTIVRAWIECPECIEGICPICDGKKTLKIGHNIRKCQKCNGTGKIK